MAVLGRLFLGGCGTRCRRRGWFRRCRRRRGWCRRCRCWRVRRSCVRSRGGRGRASLWVGLERGVRPGGRQRSDALLGSTVWSKASLIDRGRRLWRCCPRGCGERLRRSCVVGSRVRRRSASVSERAHGRADARGPSNLELGGLRGGGRRWQRRRRAAGGGRGRLVCTHERVRRDEEPKREDAC